MYLVVIPLYSSLICNMNNLVLLFFKAQIVRNTLLKCPEKENPHRALDVNCLTTAMASFKHIAHLLVCSECSRGQVTPCGELTLQTLNILYCPGISVYLHGPPLFSRMDLRFLTYVQNKTRGKWL